MSARGSHVENSLDIFEFSYAITQCAICDDLAQIVLQTRTACDDDTDADHSLGVKPLKILQIAIEKRVFVVPFDFQRQRAGIRLPKVIDFMRDRSCLLIVYDLADRDPTLVPALPGQCASQASGRPRFAAAASDQIDRRDLDGDQRLAETHQQIGKIPFKDGQGMIADVYVEARPFEIVESHVADVVVMEL